MTIRHLYPAVEPSLNLDFANSRKLDPRITFTRASIGTYTDESGIIRTAVDNEARFDHDGDGNSLGLLIEESRTNESPYSETFQDNGDDTGWRTSGGTVTPSAGTSPSNGAASSIDGSIYKRLNWGAAGTQNATSVYVKAGTGTTGTLSYQNSNGGGISFDLVAGTVTPVYTCDGTFIEAVGGGWFRIGFNRTSTSTLTALNLYLTTTPGETVLFWGAQVEKTATFSTSYIPTTSSTFTRGADVASMTGTNFSSWYNQSEGTIVASFPRQTYATGGAKRILSFANDDVSSMSAGNGIVFGNHLGGLTEQRWRIRGNTLVGFGISTGINNTGLAYAVSDSAMVFDGGTVETGAGATFPAPLDRLNVFPPNAPISRLTYYPVRLPDATLQALTL